MKSRFWITLSALAVVAVAAAVLPQVTASAEQPRADPKRAIPQGCTVTGDYEVCLSDPTAASDGRDRLVEDRLQEITRSAGDGDTIRVGMFTWTRPGLAEDLVAAKDRGADVKVAIDGVNEQDQTKGFTVLNDGGVALTSCDESCLGTNINHTKYYLSEIGGTKAVAVSSSNMTTTQTELFNNLLRVTGDAKLYDFYMGYFNRMFAQSWTYDGVTWGDDDKTIVGDSGTGGYVYPRKGDNMLWMLDSITECSDDGDGDGDPDNQVWVAASLFTSPRTGVRDRLAELENDLGCDVRVIVENTDTEAWVEASGLDKSKVVTVAKSHNKLFIVDAKYLGNWDEITIAGSHNLTGTSVETNDEVMMRVSDATITGLYKDYHAGMFATAG